MSVKHLIPKNADLFDFSHSVAGVLLDPETYPWESLDAIADFIRKVGPTLDPALFENRGNDIYIARSARIAPTALINGPCLIDENAEIRHCAFIRGSAIVGKDAVVGNSCELKNCLLFDNVQVPHFNYVGDSILGYRSHMGAGAVTSNVKSDKTLVTVKAADEQIETGRKKFGALLGDLVEVGCNSVLCPGTIIGRETNVYPLSRVRGVIPDHSIFKGKNNMIPKH